LIQHGDRILIGSHHYFLYVDPQINTDEECEWEIAMKEANKDQMGILQSSDEFDQKMKEMEEKMK
jgi:hypothetical protein